MCVAVARAQELGVLCGQEGARCGEVPCVDHVRGVVRCAWRWAARYRARARDVQASEEYVLDCARDPWRWEGRGVGVVGGLRAQC